MGESHISCRKTKKTKIKRKKTKATLCVWFTKTLFGLYFLNSNIVFGSGSFRSGANPS